MIGMWFFGSFFLFSAMITKFHHYIFPAVPPAAMMVGILLDRLWGPDPEAPARRTPPRERSSRSLAPLVLLAMGIGALYGDLRGFDPRGASPRQRRRIGCSTQAPYRQCGCSSG